MWNVFFVLLIITIIVTDKPGIALTGQPHTNTEEVVTVKEPLTPYIFQVRAYIPTSSKKNVASDMSESVICQGQGVPVKISKVEDGVLVSWREFAEENPGVVEWILQYKADNSTQEHNVTLPGEVTNYTLPSGGEAAWVRLLGSRVARWPAQELSLLPWSSARAQPRPGAYATHTHSLTHSLLNQTTGKPCGRWSAQELSLLPWRAARARSPDAYAARSHSLTHSLLNQTTGKPCGRWSAQELSLLPWRAARARSPDAYAARTHSLTHSLLNQTTGRPCGRWSAQELSLLPWSAARARSPGAYAAHTHSHTLLTEPNNWAAARCAGRRRSCRCCPGAPRVHSAGAYAAHTLFLTHSLLNQTTDNPARAAPVRTQPTLFLTHSLLTQTTGKPRARSPGAYAAHTHSLTHSLLNQTTDKPRGRWSAQELSLLPWSATRARSPGAYAVHTHSLTHFLLNQTTGKPRGRWSAQELSLLPWSAARAVLVRTQTTLTRRRRLRRDVTAVPQDVNVSDVGVHGFTVKWRCDEADSSPEMYSFRVCVKKVEGTEECQESYKSSATLEGLEPGSEYEVRVQALVQGRFLGGAFSDPIRVTTQPEGQWRVGDLSYTFVNSSAVRVRWSGQAARYTVRHSARLRLPVEQWPALATTDTSVLITGIEPTEQTYVMVTGYEPLGHSRILTIPAQVKDLDAQELRYAYTQGGVRVWWRGAGRRAVRFAQNITRPLEHWRSVNVTQPSVQLNDLDPTLPVYVMVTLPGLGKSNQVLTIPPRPVDNYNLYLSLGVGAVVFVLCAMSIAVAFFWRRYKKAGLPVRTRRRNQSANEGTDGEGSEMKALCAGAGARLANGACGEPLLNGHARHAHSKTPNGKLKKDRLYEAFDVSRNDHDTTTETVLDDSTSTFNFLDTSRRPEFESRPDLTANNSFQKLPDDNMNSELNRGTEFHLDNSKIQPTLQPNG
ncbi:unnamed protein product [Parnassius apollo]|uniref:(apollo) hypothetical protein n=1 Tax=Parnassius apollo TaxID=110799 RepID=A0A8S3XN65_PARAO|nr:unnamed protein product [Parnassius apollo]